MSISGETDIPPYSGCSHKLRSSLFFKRRPYADRHFLSPNFVPPSALLLRPTQGRTQQGFAKALQKDKICLLYFFIFTRNGNIWLLTIKRL